MMVRAAGSGMRSGDCRPLSDARSRGDVPAAAPTGQTSSRPVAVLRSLVGAILAVTSASAGANDAPRSEACAGVAVRVVVVSTAGVPRHATCEELLAEKGPADMHHGWRWSADEAPRRVLPDEWPELRRDAAPAGTLVLEVRGTPRSATNLSVIAGPQDMWQSVFEELMPRWSLRPERTVSIPCDSETPWRLRVISDGVASGWIDVPAARGHVVVRVRESKNLEFNGRTPDGSPVDQMVARVFSAGDSLVGSRTQPVAVFVGDGGRLVLPSVPTDDALRMLFEGAEAAPRMVEGRPHDLPTELEFSPGARIVGTVLDGDTGEAVEGAVVSADYWAHPSLAWAISSIRSSDAFGAWEIAGLPAGDAVVAVSAAGFGAYSERVAVEAGARIELGAVALHRGAELKIGVRDDLGRAIGGAVVRVGSGPGSVTDDKGRALLTRIPLTGAELTVSADSHLRSVVPVRAPFPETLDIQLTRAYRVAARFVDADGLPVIGGRARIETGTSTAFEEVDSEGRLTAELVPDAEYHLDLEGPTTPPVRLEIPPGAPGELRDLGTIAAPRGHVVMGTVISEETGEPVSAARVWTLRPSPRGPLVAWMQKDLIEAATDGDGSFLIKGLPAGYLTLRVDAPGYARGHAEVELGGDDGGFTDLDLVRLPRGNEIQVEVSSRESDGMSASLDLRGEGLPADMLQAPVTGNRAVFHSIAPGSYDLVVQRGSKQICAQTVSVGESDETVECEGEDVRVTGTVVVGDSAGGAGTTVWRGREQSDRGFPEGIMTVATASGLRRQSTFSTRRMDVVVPVARDGRFDTLEVSSGAWRVAWYPESGGAGASVDVDVPEVEEFETVLRFPAIEVAGIVVDENGEPLPDARVRELLSGNLAIADASGEFRLTGLAPGPAELQAHYGMLQSEVLSLTIEADRSVEPPILVVREDPEGTLRVEVLDEGGRPASSAFVFLQSGSGVDQIASADVSGIAEFRLPDPVPSQVRAAAFAGGSWILGTMRDTARLGGVLRLTGQPVGSIVVVSAESPGSPAVTSTEGWDLSWLLTRLGMRPMVGPSSDLRLGGIPEGTYTVTLRSATTVVSVREGREVVAELE